MTFIKKISVLIILSVVSTIMYAQKQPARLIRVLIVDGFSNHDWKLTTQATKHILEESGRFKVDVSTAPPLPDDVKWADWNPRFTDYDVVIQNTNNISNKNLKWPLRVQQALESYVKGGGGLYALHSANNAFPDWKEYDQMIGMGWRPKETGFALEVDQQGNMIKIPPGEGKGTSHGKRFTAMITTFTPHPINKGFPEQWLTPNMELYTYARGPAENLTVLSYATDSATNRNWPVEWIVNYGKGHVYTSSMGHLWQDEIYPIGYRCIGFQTTMIRVTEWLATGKVTYPIPGNFPTKAAISVRNESDYPK